VPDSTNGIDLANSQGSAYAADYSVKAWLLAHDVPAISQPAASNPVNEEPGNDMNKELKTGNWGDPGNWKHSDLKKQALDGVFKLFKDKVTRGDLKKNIKIMIHIKPLCAMLAFSSFSVALRCAKILDHNPTNNKN